MSLESARQIVIGDVHGCIHALDTLVEAISPLKQDQLIFLGDLIDNGPDTRGVLERIIEIKRRCSVVLIQGNHEEMLLAARESEHALEYWAIAGGVASLNSYRFGGGLSEIPRAHWMLLDECRPYHETEGHIFAHANYVPDLPMPMQPGYQLRWALFEPDKMQPHVSGKTVLVGHTEQARGEILDLGFAMCIDTACCRYGWLTAIDVTTKQIWQASRWGMLREVGELSERGRLSELFRLGNTATTIS